MIVSRFGTVAAVVALLLLSGCRGMRKKPKFDGLAPSFRWNCKVLAYGSDGQPSIISCDGRVWKMQ